MEAAWMIERRTRYVLFPALAVALAAGIAAPVAGRADQAPPASFESNPDSALATALRGIEGTPLTLDQAVSLALQRSTSARDAEAALRAARGAARRERGAFDPELFGELRKTSQDQPTVSVFAGVPVDSSGLGVLRLKQTDLNAGARVTLPIGTQLSASVLTSRRESSSDFTTLLPEYDASGVLSVTQPLLKGFGPSAWGERSATQRELEAAQAQRDDAVLSVRAQTEQSYWDLYAAERDFAVQRLIRDRAAAFLTETELRAKAGLVGPNQVASARVFLAEQEQALLDGEERLDQTSDQLATLLGQRPAGEGARYRPVDSPPRDFPVEDADSLVARAVARSLELRASERLYRSALARARGARWDALPALDLFGTLGGNGLSGRGRDIVSPVSGDTLRTPVDGGAGDVWSQVRKRDFPTWSAGVRVSIPIGFREGAGERQRLRGEADRAEQRMIATRRSVEERVRVGYRELLHAKRRLEAAENGVTASQEQVRIGALEYRIGRTTAFELVRLAADLAAAQQRYSQALVRTAKAAAALSRLTAGGPGAPTTP
jgi:outer membrane protein